MPTINRNLARVVTVGLGLALGAASTARAAAPRDRTPPTTPTNLRVTAMTAYTVTLAWNPSTDNSGRFSYVICCSYTNSMTAPQGVSSFVYTAGLESGRTFTLRMYAVDAAGNYSKPSNSVTFTLPRDTIPPSQARISTTGHGSTHVLLLWSAIEDGPNVWFTVFMNGSPILYGTRNTSTTLTLLQPETTYAFTVQAMDFAGQRSPVSEPVTVTTDPPRTGDTTPPTSPAPLSEQNWGDCEVELDWAESTDDVDPQWLIEYKVFVNGRYDHSTSLRYTRTIVYGDQNGANEFQVIAADTVGNESEPATVIANLNCPF